MMRTFKIIVGAIVLVIGGFVAWWWAANPTHFHRFRMVVEVEADGQLRSGSSVIEVRTTEQKIGLPETLGLRSHVLGEAVFVDLGNGKHVIAILGFGPTGSEDAAPRLSQIGSMASDHAPGTAGLTGMYFPTLVTFTDLNDPKTARVVLLEEFEQVFGPGVRFKRAYVEIVSRGTWPFSALGWPHDLVGEPVTRGIEARMPMLVTHREWMWRVNSTPSKFTPQYHLFTRS